MKKLIKISCTALIVVMLQGCNGDGSTNGVTDSTVVPNSIPGKVEKDTTRNTETTDKSAKTIREKMLGFWSLVGEENASFEIKNDKLYYPEHFKSYRYLMKEDSIRIKYDDYEGVFFVKMKGMDTLILSGDDDEEHVYYRFRK
jgi:hypothetical protein